MDVCVAICMYKPMVVVQQQIYKSFIRSSKTITYSIVRQKTIFIYILFVCFCMLKRNGKRQEKGGKPKRKNDLLTREYPFYLLCMRIIFITIYTYFSDQRADCMKILCLCYSNTNRIYIDIWRDSRKKTKQTNVPEQPAQRYTIFLENT